MIAVTQGGAGAVRGQSKAAALQSKAAAVGASAAGVPSGVSAGRLSKGAVAVADGAAGPGASGTYRFSASQDLEGGAFTASDAGAHPLPPNRPSNPPSNRA